MRLVSLVTILASLQFASMSAYASTCAALGKTQRANIDTVLAATNSNFNDKNSDKVFEYISQQRYIQHVPNGKDGGESLIKLIEFFKQKMPSFKVQNVRSFAEKDFVLTQSIDYLDDKPVEVSYDWYRVNSGKITEHWDVVSEFKIDINPSDYTDGAGVDYSSCLDKERLRSIALDYFYTTWDSLDTRVISEHVSEKFVQHNPDAKIEGMSDKTALLKIVGKLKQDKADIHIDISKVLVTGDFVAIHAKWKQDGKEFSVTDLLRFDNGYQIIEHWDGFKEIPAENSNPRDPVF